MNKVLCIQTLYPKALHVTCLAHALYNMCKEMRVHFPKIDRLIAEMKKTFLKCLKRISILNEKCPDIPNLPKPITTRWGTWITAVEYYCTYLNEIKSAVEEFSENAQCVNVVKELMKDQSLHSNLVFITTNFWIYTTCNYTIRKKEVFFYFLFLFQVFAVFIYSFFLSETLAKSIGILFEAKQKLKEANDKVAKLILEK
jgi:hypothetical protein